MNFRKLYVLLIGLISLSAIMLPTESLAQWSGTYGNSWLAGKYGPNWLRIGVTQKGIHKVTLTGDFIGKANQLHLYHRGVEVKLISASNSEIEFYGVPNDGESDALLYRPYTGTKRNPYYSWFSDESAYFLTFFTSSSTQLAVSQSIVAPSGSPEAYHLQRDLTVYSTSDTYDGTQNLVYHDLDQSYFVEGKGRSSKMYWKETSGIGNPTFQFPLEMKNLVIDPNRQPVIQVQVNGRTYVNNIIQASVGKTLASLTNYASPNGLLQFSEFVPFDREFTVRATTDNVNADVTNGSGFFQLESTKITASDNTTGVYSVNFIQTKYPQSFDMTGVTTKTFNLLPSSNSNVLITNAPSNARVYDITDGHNPRKIEGVVSGANLQVMVNRTGSNELNLLVTSAPITVAGGKVVSVTFENYSPSDKDYLIITNHGLKTVAGTYEAYRKSTKGGSYKTLLVEVKDIYNQFNYGEPSPVAIRRFVDYMLSSGIRTSHNLLLIGPSTTLWNKMPRELEEDVPTIGFPGSDVLLIEGLAGSPAETPAIPIGRISANTAVQVTHYLNKVNEYETYPQDGLSWRRKGLHISGGIYSGENTLFANYLSNYAPLVVNPPFSGSITAKVKGDNDFDYPNDKLDISPEINSGVGFTSYFGHGSSRFTDNNIGYMSDGLRKYANKNKYPIMYFNGCGVANVFNGAFDPYPASSTTQIPLSSDWLLAEDKGAIAIIGNSYYAFEASSNNYLGVLYSRIFKSDIERKTIGQIHRHSAQIVMTGNTSGRTLANSYDMANTHQSLLFGDPALKVLNLSNPLPVSLISFQAKIQDADQVKLDWKTAWEKGNSHFILERSYNAKTFEAIGIIEGRGDSNSENNYSFIDKNPNPGVNYYRLVQVDQILNNSSTSGNKEYSRMISVVIPNTSQVVVMPNPAFDVVKIKLMNNLNIENVNLVNLKGESFPLKYNDSKEISISSYPAGVYMLEIITTEKDVYRRKIVKY